MEPAKIDWKNIKSRFVEDEIYEHINAPKWIDFTAPEDYVDDQAWFCSPDCRHPKTAEDFLRSAPPSKSKHMRSASISEIFPLSDRNRRDAKSERSTAPKLPHKFTGDSENKNPNFSTPPPPPQNNQSKIMKAGIKSSTEEKKKKKPLNESPSVVDSLQNDQRPKLKTTLSARNLLGGREILSQITEFCNELKKLAMRAKERENSEASNAKKGCPEEISGESSEEWSRKREKEKKKPLLLEVVGEGNSEAKELKKKKQRSSNKRNEGTENKPITIDLKNIIKGKEERLLLQVRTCPPSPQCFTTTPPPLNPSRPKPIGTGVLQELKQSHNKEMKEEEPRDKEDDSANKTVSTMDNTTGTEAKSLDMFWFLKPCTFLNSVH